MLESPSVHQSQNKDILTVKGHMKIEGTWQQVYPESWYRLNSSLHDAEQQITINDQDCNYNPTSTAAKSAHLRQRDTSSPVALIISKPLRPAHLSLAWCSISTMKMQTNYSFLFVSKSSHSSLKSMKVIIRTKDQK